MTVADRCRKVRLGAAVMSRTCVMIVAPSRMTDSRGLIPRNFQYGFGRTIVLRYDGGKWLAAARRVPSSEPSRPSPYNDGSRHSYHWSARHTALIKVLQVHLVSALWDSNQAHLTSTFFSLSPERDWQCGKFAARTQGYRVGLPCIINI